MDVMSDTLTTDLGPACKPEGGNGLLSIEEEFNVHHPQASG